jgi:MarR family transcriptional regulator, organic hydroperoxide resistance regulator
MMRSAGRKAEAGYSVEFGVVAGVGFGRRLRATSRLLDRLLADVLAPHSLTVSQYFILRELWDEEGLTLREVASRVGVAEPSTMTTLELMVERGLVQRTQSKQDRRKTHVHLTASGRALQKPVKESLLAAGAIAFADLRASDLERAIEIFDTVVKNIERHTSSGEQS